MIRTGRMPGRFQQLQKIRSWSVEQVQMQLKHQGLHESSEGVRKREVDGDALLVLTEGQLALWRDVSSSEKKQLLKFIEELQANPEKFVDPPIKQVVESPKPDLLPVVEQLPTSSSGKSSPLSGSDAWDTDFDDDKDVDYSNFDASEPSAPVCPPKPANLPKPPIPESNYYNHVRHIVSGLNLPEHPHDVYDEEEYESLDADSRVPPLMKEQSSEEYESIKENADAAEYYLQPIQLTPPVPEKKWISPSSPYRHSDDSSAHTSPGNSGDGVTGLLGELFRKIRGPDIKEKAPTPTPTTSSKPLPPEPRSGSLNTHRPLPPTPQIKAVKAKLELNQQPWYHSVNRKQSEDLLLNSEDGCFLVRPSSQGQNALTLTLWYGGRVYNISIRHRSDGRYALGSEKAKEQSFSSIEELIQNYQSEKLVLYSGGEKTGRALLTSSPPRAPC